MTNERNYWFVLFSCGDSRSTYYGWLALNKDEYTKSEAKKSGNRSAKRKGETRFNYFVVDSSYVTDSSTEFLKKCSKVNVNPDLTDYI